ncbi:hypothetical protein [Serinicoccus profundi]|uniref:hypothetical protein n=1 Tax=Serinicoccus profundi TaxID=1078471 RepID=UPI000497B544|nr:hypothetical protein [Serinicoccus profundi]
MGLNMGLVYVRGAEVGDLAAIGLVPTGERMSADVASTSPDGELVVARPVGGWLLLVGPELLLGFEDEMIARTLDRQVVAAMLGSTSDTFSFARCDPDGTRRHVVDSYGERAVDEGPPLPEEAGIERLTEDTIQGLAVEVTGVNFWDSFMEEDWQVLSMGGQGQDGGGDIAQSRPSSPTQPVEPTQPQPRKGFLARLFGR